MAWEHSDRRATLPKNWSSIRRSILIRDPTCQLHLPGCTIRSTEVDHIDNRLNHTPTNLRGVCHTCHVERTKQQANAARPTTRRPAEPHPGLR